MLSSLISFLFPKTCFYCKQLHFEKGILCDICLVGLDLIVPKGRCHTCFRESPWRKCLYCHKHPSPWYRAGSLFSDGSSAEVLMQDSDRFAKEVAAFFIIQYVRLYWPLPDAFYVEHSLQPIAKPFSKFLPLQLATKRKEYAGKKILFLAKHHDQSTIPEFLQGTRIFYLSYTYSF